MRPEPRILAFDTSGPACDVALIAGDEVLALRHEPMERGQAERLIPLLQEVLAQAGLGWAGLDALAVGTGPGNFTGVRIAVAAARGLALASRLPALGIGTLEAAAEGLPRPLTVLEEARRGEVYLQAHGPEGAAPARLIPAEEAARVTGAVTGSAAPLAPGAQALPPALPRVLAMARIAARRAPPFAPPAPFYLRGADALPPSDPPPRLLDA